MKHGIPPPRMSKIERKQKRALASDNKFMEQLEHSLGVEIPVYVGTAILENSLAVSIKVE